MYIDDMSTLDKNGFVTVQYPPSLRARVVDAMGSWKSFCDLPLEEKLKLSKDTERHIDFGYMRRDEPGPRGDHKELFHLVGKNLPEIYEKARLISDERAIAFIKAIDVLLEEAAPLVQEFACKIEEHYKLPGFEAEVMRAVNNWTFRYLHYFSQDNDMLAYEHADRKGFTLHLNESDSGGEYFGFDRVWRPWHVSDKQTIIFPSIELQYRSKCALQALWHRILSTPQTRHTGRFAMVAFIDFRHSHRIVRRVQEFDPGFNYGISFDEYREHFAPR